MSTTSNMKCPTNFNMKHVLQTRESLRDDCTVFGDTTSERYLDDQVRLLVQSVSFKVS